MPAHLGRRLREQQYEHTSPFLAQERQRLLPHPQPQIPLTNNPKSRIRQQSAPAPAAAPRDRLPQLAGALPSPARSCEYGPGPHLRAIKSTVTSRAAGRMATAGSTPTHQKLLNGTSHAKRVASKPNGGGNPGERRRRHGGTFQISRLPVTKQHAAKVNAAWATTVAFKVFKRWKGAGLMLTNADGPQEDWIHRHAGNPTKRLHTARHSTVDVA